MYRIGEFSRLCRVPVSALRYYADLGLLPPADVDEDSGYRYFTVEQLPRLNRVLALKDLGLTLDEIRSVLDQDLSAAELRGMLRMKRAELDRAASEAVARLTRVETRLRTIEREGTMPEHEVVLKTLEPQRVLAIREVVPEPRGVSALLMDGFAALGGQGVTPAGPPFTRYHDPEFRPTDLDVEVDFPVAVGVENAVETPAGRKLEVTDVPGGEAAVVLHEGPYETIDEAYSAIGTWIADNGFHIAGPPQEAYLRAPGGGELEPLTEIRFPVSRG